VGVMKSEKYASYKPSEIEGLGEIPAHWEIKRIKEVISKIASGVTPKGGSEVYVDAGTPFLRSQNVHDDGLRLHNVSFITAEANAKMRGSQARPGDIVLNITGASIGRSCVVPPKLKSANISQHILLLRFKKPLAPFLANYIKSDFIKKRIDAVQLGASKQALNMGQALNFPLLLPPISEQHAIARYLERQTSLIDRSISLLQKKRLKHENLRKTLINETVCRGLAPTAPRKPSGVEWLGAIPAHWKVQRLKDVAAINEKALPETTDPEYSFRYIDIGNVDNSGLQDDAEWVEFQKAPSRARRIVRKNDVIISTVRTYLKAVASFDYEPQDVIVSTGFAVLTPNKTVTPSYLAYQVRSDSFVDDVIRASVGVSYPAVNSSAIASMHFIYPPLQEQAEIASFLDEKTKKIDSIVINLKAQIDTLKELRKTLINEVVTGKLKVTE